MNQITREQFMQKPGVLKDLYSAQYELIQCDEECNEFCQGWRLELNTFGTKVAQQRADQET